MQPRTLLLLFLFLSILFITFSLWCVTKPLYLKQLQMQRASNIQKVYRKSYLKRRNQYVPQRSVFFAQKAINQLLKQTPILFNENSFELENNQSSNHQTLTQVISILNHMKEKYILKIETHTDRGGSKKHNLQLSQQRADRVKSYIEERTTIPFISAIGYGREIPLKSKKKPYLKRIELKLQRIKE